MGFLNGAALAYPNRNEGEFAASVHESGAGGEWKTA